MMTRHSILVVDDEMVICDVVRDMLETDSSYSVVTETDPAKALSRLAETGFDLVLTDLIMGDFTGMQIIEAALEHNEDTVVVLMTGYPTIENAVSALKHGAYDYIIKPFKLDTLRLTIERGLRKQQLARENMHLKDQLSLFKLAEAMGSTNNLNSTLNQVLKLSLREFSADAASILFYDSGKSGKLILQAIQETSGDETSHAFLEGDTEHSHLALRSKIVEIENIVTVSADATDIPQQITSYLSCPLLARNRVIGLLNIERSGFHREFSTGELQCLKIIATKAAYAISNSKLFDDLEKAYLSTLMALANAVEARDQYTSGHTVRVTYLAELIANELGWDGDRLFSLTMGCSLHDIGKIGVPDSILNKPGKLNDHERQAMERHTELGARIIEGIPFLEPCRDYITSHHEHWDGSGYPNGLKGEEIPIEGRLLTVADTFDAIVTDRPYRRGKSVEAAVQELKDFAGRQFDPYIVQVFVEVLEKNREKIETIYNVHSPDAAAPAEAEPLPDAGLKLEPVKK